ncbi:MAG: hypothetical protein AAFR04_02115 [Pseudomonadota bacterium]
MAAHAKRKGSLQAVANDTGRTAYCGPYVVSAITGYAISACEAAIQRYRQEQAANQVTSTQGHDGSDVIGSTAEGATQGGGGVVGTHADEVAAALASFGYAMTLREDFQHLPRRERPSLWGWMQKPRNAWSYYVLAIHKGKEGHWIGIKGVKLCDTFTQGSWTFVCDGPHKGARIMEVFEVKRALTL